MKDKAQNYRHALGRFIGKEIILECSDFKMRSDDYYNQMLILQKPLVTKVSGVSNIKPFVVGHLWIRVPKGDERSLTYSDLVARKVRIKGIVKEYSYLETGESQVGVIASLVQVLKYKKHIAKTYNLRPGAQVSKAMMRRIVNTELRRIEQDELRKAAANVVNQGN